MSFHFDLGHNTGEYFHNSLKFLADFNEYKIICEIIWKM